MQPFNQHMLNKVGGAVAIGLVLNLIFLTVVLVFFEIKGNNKDPVMLLLGGLMTQVGNVVSFFFASTVSSRRQEETIGTLADTTAKAAQAALPPASVSLGPGEQASVATTDAGTVIRKEGDPV